MDEVLVQQMGLLLTQLRYARRALEDIERNTARYTTFAFASALAAGPRFGEPPMFGGALKVHVVNINDLAPGGNFLEGLLGGIGRLFGGLFGGLIGGTVAGVALPVMIAQVQNIAATVERILKQLGTPKEPVAADQDKKTQAGSGLFGKLDEIRGVVNAFTALFQAANGDPKQAAQTANPMTPEATRWLAVLQTADSLVRGISLVLKGMTILIPMVLGALAMLIARLDTIKLAVVDLLRFILREALLLRGVALTVLFDTLATAAKLGANILGILGLTIQEVITSVFKIFNSVFDAALAAIEFLSGGLAKTIDALLKWLVESVTTALAVIGDTRIFRVAVYAIQMLPYVLPSLVRLVRNKPIEDTDQKSLNEAKQLAISEPALTGPAATKLPSFPSVSATLLDPAAVGVLRDTIDKSLGSITTLMGDLFGDTSKGLQKLGGQLDAAASDKVFNEALDKHIVKLKDRSGVLADSLNTAHEAAKKAAESRPATGLEAIAIAYEDWLASPQGLTSLLGNITAFFKESPTEGPEAEKSLAAKAIGPTVIDRPRATVEIDDLVIDLRPPPPESDLPGGTPGVMKVRSDQTPDDLLRAVAELMHEMDQRGMTFSPGSLLMQV